MNSFRLSKSVGLAVAVLFAAFGIAGCGEKGVKKITLNGTISYKGQPLRSGILQLVGDNGYYGTAVINADGTFTVTDVIPGELKVSIQQSPNGEGSSDGKKTAAAPKAVALPDKYRSAETSGLKYPITETTKDLKIELE